MNRLSEIEKLLDNYCRSKIADAAAIDSRYVDLWQEIHRYLMAGGKRMRPRLVLFAYNAYKGKDSQDIAPVAAAWELLHACLLVHDDIIDRDQIRHGQPNIAGRYQSIYSKISSTDSSHYASSAALLGGDLLLMSAYELITNCQLADDQKIKALNYLNQALFAVAGGELIDTDSVLYPIKSSNPESVAAFKTASYSLQLPLRSGADIAGAPAEELNKLSQIGLYTGVAYQLRDDLLGVFGNSAITGKSNRSDIIEKKRTFLIQKAIERLDFVQADRITNLFAPNHNITNEESEEIVDLITSSGAKQAVEESIDSQSRQAINIIGTLNIDHQHKKYLSDIISKLTSRAS